MKIAIILTYNDDVDPDEIIDYYYPPHIRDAVKAMLGADGIEADVIPEEEQE